MANIIGEDDMHGKAGRKYLWDDVITSIRQEAQAEEDMRRQQVVEIDRANKAAAWDDLNAARQAVASQNAQAQLNRSNAADCMVRALVENGGSWNPVDIQWFNQRCGYDGKTSGLVGGGMSKDGTIVMKMLAPGRDGNPMTVDLPIAPQQQAVMMYRNPAVFDENATGYIEKLLVGKMGYSPDMMNRLRMMGRGMAGENGAGGRQVGHTATFQGPDTRPHGVHTFSSDGRGGMTRSDWTPEYGYSEQNFGTRAPDANARWKQVSVGPSDTNNGGSDKSQVRVYENSQTGERVTVKDGENLRDVLAQSQVVGTTGGKRGTLGLRGTAGTRTSSGTGGMTAEEKLEYLREQEKLRKERELAVQGSRNDAKTATQKPNNMSADLFDRLTNIMRDPEAMKNKDIASLVSGIKAQYGIGDGSVTPTGVAGSLDEAKKGDAMSRDQLSEDEFKAVDSANPPEGWDSGTKAWERMKQENPLAVLRYLNQNGRQLDGGEQLIRYTDANGNKVEANGFRDKDGRIYGVRKGADGKNYRGDEIKDAKGTFKNLGNGKYEDTPFEKKEEKAKPSESNKSKDVQADENKSTSNSEKDSKESVKEDDKSTYDDAEKEAAWKKWKVERPRKGDNPSQLRKMFEEWWTREKFIDEKLKEGQNPGFITSGR